MPRSPRYRAESAASPDPMRPTRVATSAAVVILAVGIATAVNLITLASLWDAIASDEPGLSENATQVITALGGGIIGVIGAAIGYKAGSDAAAISPEDPSKRLTVSGINDDTP